MTRVRRREALLLGVALPLVAARPARATDESLITLLARAHRLELATLRTYEISGQHGALGDLADAFARHEREQAAAVEQALEALGAAGTAPPADGEQLDALVGGFPETPGDRALAAYAVEVELAALRAHRDVLGATDESPVIRTAATIMAAAGTHLAVLRDRLGRRPVATL